MMAKKIKSHRELEVYQLAFEAAMEIFEVTKSFPREERCSLTDQIRRSSRSVCASITEAWRRRRYKGSFVYRLNDAEAEAAETQTWLEFAVKCSYLDAEVAGSLYGKYDHVLGKLVTMIRQPEKWIIGGRGTRGQGEGETR
jgi:four helix bundle protein